MSNGPLRMLETATPYSSCITPVYTHIPHVASSDRISDTGTSAGSPEPLINSV